MNIYDAQSTPLTGTPPRIDPSQLAKGRRARYDLATFRRSSQLVLQIRISFIAAEVAGNLACEPRCFDEEVGFADRSLLRSSIPQLSGLSRSARRGPDGPRKSIYVPSVLRV